MMFLYLFLLLLLLLARLFVTRRVARLEKKYERASRSARDLLAQPLFKQGNNNRLDPTAHAKQQYLLGQVVEQRDRVEARYIAWQARADKVARLLSRVRCWKGRTVPYVVGVVDLATVLAFLTLFGLIEFPSMSQAIESLLARMHR
jgi:hypothetical protein